MRRADLRLPLSLALFWALLLPCRGASHDKSGSPKARAINASPDFCAEYGVRFAAKPAKVLVESVKSGPRPPGHSAHGPAFDEGPRSEAVLDKRYGKMDFPTSCSETAQRFIDQGLAQFHGFLWYEAERSFRQAWKEDSTCAIAVWGMAMAAGGDIWTPQTTPRAASLARTARRVFEETKAVEARLAPEERERWRKRRAIESQLIDAYAHYTADNSARSREHYLERMRILAKRDGIEVKALLVFALLKNDDLAKRPGASFSDPPTAGYLEETDGLIDEILRANPNHPAHHYKIHLWDYVDPTRALDSADACGPSEPAIAHMWHMPGHLYFKLHRYAEALWHQEASARVDHKYLAEARLMPFLNANYVHNNGWLAETMLRVGRGEDAKAMARSLIDLPRHPRHRGPQIDGARTGWDRLLDALDLTEDWAAVAELESKPLPYQPATLEEELKWQRLRAVAAYFRRDAKAVQASADSRARIDCLATLAGKKQGSSVERVRRELAVLEALKADDRERAREALAVLETRVPGPVPYFESRPGLVKQRLAAYYAAAGDWESAHRMAEAAVSEAPGEVLPLAHRVDLLAAGGRTDEARPLYRELGKLARFADRSLPVFKRIEKNLGPLPRVVAGLDWKDPKKHPALETMGPLLWTPPAFGPFEAKDSDGRVRTADDFRGKPTLFVFNLGGSCVRCNAQLAALARSGARLREAGVQVVVVSPDSPEQLKELRPKLLSEGLDLTLLSDPKHEAFRKVKSYDDFEEKPLHSLVLTGKDGRERWRDTGSEPFTDIDGFLVDEATRLLRSSGRGD